MAEDEQTPAGGDEAAGADETGSPEDAAGGAQPTEEEMRAQLDEEIRQVRIEDLVLQSAVSILNLSARRIAKEDERDLPQAKIGIDAASALIDHVPEAARPQLQQAVSELKMLFAQHSGGDPGPAEAAPPAPEKPKGPGLWTPGS